MSQIAAAADDLSAARSTADDALLAREIARVREELCAEVERGSSAAPRAAVQPPVVAPHSPKFWTVVSAAFDSLQQRRDEAKTAAGVASAKYGTLLRQKAAAEARAAARDAHAD